MTQDLLTAETKMCDRGGPEGCAEPAVYTYQWAWGETGVCCARHGMLARQIAAQIKRDLQLVPLAPAGPAPLTRDERTQLVARALVLEEELEEAKSRGLELYRVNQQIHGQMKLAEVRAAEAHAQMSDAKNIADQLREQLAARDREHGDLVSELDRLRILASVVDATAVDTTVVDGK